MASIRIHQDLYNFERKIKGFTVRQAVSIAVGAMCALAGAAFATGALGLPLSLLSCLGMGLEFLIFLRLLS